MRAFVSWSGGKECSLACHKAMVDQGVNISYLLNMVSEDGKKSRSHGVDAAILKLQSESMEIPICQKRTAWDRYEDEFKDAILGLKRDGVTAGVFGDIDFAEHRGWVERVCGQMGIKPIFPLWQKGRLEILNEFMHAGFEAMVVSVKEDFLGREWIGRKVDQNFIGDLKKNVNVDLCGERGEYHTLVTSGPIFRKRIKIVKAKTVKKDKYYFLDILNYELS